MPIHQRDLSIPQIRLEQPLPPLPLLPTCISSRITVQIPEPLSFEPYHDEESGDEDNCTGEEVGTNQDGRRLRQQPYSDNHLSPVTPNRPSSPSQELQTQTSYHDRPSTTSPTRTTRTTRTLSVSSPQSPAPTSSQTSSRTVLPTAQENGQSKPPDYEPMYDYLRSLPRPFHAFTSPNSNTFLSPITRPQSPTEFMPYHDSVDHPFIITLSPLSPHTRPHNQQNQDEEEPPSYEELYLQHACPQRQDELLELVRLMDSENNWAEEICKFIVGMIFLALVVVGVGLAFNWGKGWGPSDCRRDTRLGKCV